MSLFISVSAQSDVSGPVFVQEPPNQVDFSNTTGAEIICQSRGTPLPKITWVKTDGTIIKDVPGLRQVGLKFRKGGHPYNTPTLSGGGREKLVKNWSNFEVD